jgi:AraC-like DNA-binding protein/quercetin dioxygenase-like cupin family protein
MRLVDQSPDELTDGAAVWLNRFEMRSGDSFGLHEHDHLHQLCWSPHGVLSVEAGGDRWSLPPWLAMWIPAGVRHDVGCARDAQLHSLYVVPDRCPIEWPAPTVVAVGVLLGEVLRHLAGHRAAGAARARAEQFMFDLLQPVGANGAALRLPADARAAAVAEGLLSRPADCRTLEEWGREVGASGRTLARQFLAQTGVSFGEWRTQARVHAAVDLLGAGGTVAAVAAAVGYRDAAAFAAVFRRHTGASPGSFARPARRVRAAAQVAAQGRR